jgi:DNA-binding NarL/FixJ family response regulator
MQALIADDHAVVRTGLKQILIQIDGIDHVDETGNGLDVLHLCYKNKYDFVVLDISMPGLNGLEVLKQLKNEFPGLPILILSIHPENQYALRVLKAGASGYLTKDSAPEELKNAVLKIASGGKYITSSVAESLTLDLSENHKSPKHYQLSDREFEVMLLIASGKSPIQIGEELCLSPKTIGTYRRRIMQKMNLKTTTDIIRYALQHELI